MLAVLLLLACESNDTDAEPLPWPVPLVETVERPCIDGTVVEVADPTGGAAAVYTVEVEVAGGAWYTPPLDGPNGSRTHRADGFLVDVVCAAAPLDGPATTLHAMGVRVTWTWVQ